MNITSAGGIISLLDEENHHIQKFALNKLNEVVGVFWAEISEAVDKIEVLYEDIGFDNRELAALVASKVYFHLGSFNDSLSFALGAGQLFDVNDNSEYVNTIISKCIDQYTKLRVHNATTVNNPVVIDPRLEDIVNRMFQRCMDDRQFKQAIGIAVETHRMDIFKDAIIKSENMPMMLTYSLRVCLMLVENRAYRNKLIGELTQLYMNLGIPDYISVCQCYIFLDDTKAVADILESLLKGSVESVLMAYQIGFDLYESASQKFLAKVQAQLARLAPTGVDIPSSVAAATATGQDDEPMDTDDDKSATGQEKTGDICDGDKALQDHIGKLLSILGGDMTIDLHLQFLIRTNKTDLLVLKNTKDAVRNSICHTATVIANSLMHCGTTCTQFLSENLDWLGRATNWAKFAATASLGVIHKGQEKEALKVMSTYLPKDTASGSAYSDGGSLYALGLIHVNHGARIIDYLLGQLKDASNEMVRHGGCLGLGLAAMGTARQDVYDQLKFNLHQDDAITGEAAGLAMGLVMIGSNDSTVIGEMVSYAKDTQHEKILRGLAVGIALTMYSQLENADSLIESLSRDKDPILRWSGMYALALAYCGSGSNEAIRKLLHVAVSDVNDDVRRIAVTSIGFILFRTPEQCPSVVSLLSESYNPFVRYGAAMALGIACAGSGLKEALQLLEPMSNDPVSYVRQGSLIASALILIQHNDSTCPKSAHFRQLYAKVIQDKHEDIMVKFGAILAQGIIDAGGRNMSVSLQTRTGHTSMEAIVGLLVFTQFWFWFPLSLFISMAFQPTTVIGLNAQLKMPAINYKSNAKPSMFAYPPIIEEKKDKAKEKVETVVLSITEKRKKKDAEKRKAEKMEVDEDKDKDTEKEKTEVIKDTAAKKDSEVEKKDVDKKEVEKKEVEQAFQMLENPARVMKAQLKVLTVDPACKYTPIKSLTNGGIILLNNNQPSEEEVLVEPVLAGGTNSVEEEEPAPPEPFEYTDDEPVADVPMSETVEGAR